MRLPVRADQTLPTFLLDAERDPSAVLLETAAGASSAAGSSGCRRARLPKVFMSAAARTGADAEEPLDVAPGEELASGMDSSHLGFAGTVEILSASGPAGPSGGGVNGFARGDVGGLDVDLPLRRAAGNAWPCIGLDVGAGRGSGPAGGPPSRRRRRRRPRRPRWPRRRRPSPGRPRVAASSSTSAGRPPGPPAGDAAEAAVSTIAAASCGAVLEVRPRHGRSRRVGDLGHPRP